MLIVYKKPPGIGEPGGLSIGWMKWLISKPARHLGNKVRSDDNQIIG